MNKKLWAGLTLGSMIVGTILTANATTISISTAPSNGLEHGKVYVWGMSSSTWDQLTNPITSAKITITNIWDDNGGQSGDDQLAFFLLDNAKMKNGGNTWYSFSDQAVIAPSSFEAKDSSSPDTYLSIAHMVTYLVPEDINTSSDNKVDLTYDFTAANLSVLESYLATSPTSNKFRDIALGIDPDCHFRLGDITLTISDDRPPVPEPATMLLFGTGIAGLAAVGRRKRN